MNWDDLRFLVTLGREGTLAATARRLAVDQTTVARRLRALEEGLGTALFERDEGLWRPTAVGARVLERAARIEEDVAGITRLAEAGAGAVGGVVRITAVSALIGEWLVPRLPGLYARHPELRVDLVASNDNLNVARREADIAIRLARPASGDFLIRKLAGVGFALYGAARGDLAVSAGDWVAYNEDLDHTPEMRRLHAMLGEGRIRLRSNSLRGLVRAVAGGIGGGAILRREAREQAAVDRAMHRQRTFAQAGGVEAEGKEAGVAQHAGVLLGVTCRRPARRGRRWRRSAPPRCRSGSGGRSGW